MQAKKLLIAILAAQAVAVTAWAHHSHGAYRMTDYAEIDGTVTEVYWINPHAWVYMEVENAQGEMESTLTEFMRPCSIREFPSLIYVMIK